MVRRTKIFICTLDGELSDWNGGDDDAEGDYRLQPTVSVERTGDGPPKARPWERRGGGGCELEPVAISVETLAGHR